ncbi:MAG: T9SS type A sorting domain-containing protein [Muribaculaceae bacterium]|nr:T9SS type A sorting domain-containing protein [Muribaculaceae bacterium]
MASRLLIFVTGILYALCSWGQSPGGVPGAELWHITTPTTVYLDSTYYWKDLSGDDVKAHDSSNANIEYEHSRRFMQAFNFNPAFHFKTIVADSLISNLHHTNMSQATILGVFAPDSTSIAQNSRIYSAYGRDDENFSVFKESINGVVNNLQYGVDTTLNLLADGENDVLFRQSALRTLTYQRSFVPNHSVWGEPKESSIIFPSYNSSNFIFCPELIVYGRELSHYERRKVESYLAIKYGITLRGSFYAPDSTLIWDSQSNESYNHRVTSIANYSNSKLFQPLSTTSYEELPNCAIDSLCDSYYLRSSYNKPTSNRLLVMGREYGSPMPDNSYMIWGDNNSSLEISANQTDTLWQVMNRKWKLFSNLPFETNDTITLVTSNISIDKIKDGVFNITRGISSSVSDITFGQNTSNDLHFGFICPNVYPAFDVLVKPTRSSGYGFKFNTDGSVYTVGLTRNRIIYDDARNHRIDIYKRGDNLFLQVDGVGDLSKTLVVPVALMPHTFDPLDPLGSGMQPNGGTGVGGPVIDIIPEPGYSCKGALHVYGGESLLLSNFRVDGFCNTDNQVELSYNIANALKRYRNKRTFMLIGTDEDIDPNDTRTRVFRCSEFDSRRHKTIFHNVPFKDDSTQYFTFATYDGFDVDLNAISATCVNGVSQNNGELEIDIKYGTPLFKYALAPCVHNDSTNNMNLQQLLNYHMNYIAQNPSCAQTGWFNEMTHTLADLSPGDYYFRVDQIGGDNVYAAPFVGSNNRYVCCGENISMVSWQIGDTVSIYNAGFGASSGNVSIGFEINGRECYAFNGNQKELICTDLCVGDVLSLESDIGTVILSKDGITVKTISSNNYFTCFTAKFSDAEGVLTNVICTDQKGDAKNAFLYESDESVVIDSIRPMFINALVLIADCDGESEILRELQQHNYTMPYYDLPSIGDFSSDKGKLIVVPDGYRYYQAELRTKNADSAQLLVFDAAGRLITQMNMSSGEVKYANFSVPTSGVYIVKVLTCDDEYTWKLLSE